MAATTTTARTIKDFLQETYRGEVGPLIGRIYTCREQGRYTFFDLQDSSTVQRVQCIMKSSLVKDRLHRGTTVRLSGEVVTSPGKGQEIEIQVRDLQVLGQVHDPDTYPLSGKHALTRDYLRTIPHLRARASLFQAISLIKETAYRELHASFARQKIAEFQPTVITGNECESGAFPFTVTTLPLITPDLSAEGIQEIQAKGETDFFDRKVYLTVSSQMHLEAMVCSRLKDGYCMTPAFRAAYGQRPSLE